jgi:hypothetical protein
MLINGEQGALILTFCKTPAFLVVSVQCPRNSKNKETFYKAAFQPILPPWL